MIVYNQTIIYYDRSHTNHDENHDSSQTIIYHEFTNKPWSIMNSPTNHYDSSDYYHIMKVYDYHRIVMVQLSVNINKVNIECQKINSI